MEVQNEKLYATMKAYVASSIEFITQKAKADAEALSVSQESDYFATCWKEARLRSNLSALPEYAVCLKELEDEPQISRQLGVNVGPHSRSAPTRSAEGIMNYLFRLGKGPDQYTFDPERFDREYLIFEETFYSDSLLCVAVAPLQGLLMTDRVIKLSDKLEIKRLDKEEMESFRTPQSRWNDEWCSVRTNMSFQRLSVPIRSIRFRKRERKILSKRKPTRASKRLSTR